MLFLFLLILLNTSQSFFLYEYFLYFLSFFSHMPQLDFFFFFSCYISFFFFLGGFFAFHTWSLPFLLSFTKFSSFLFFFLLFLFFFFLLCVFFLDYFFSIFQIISLYNSLFFFFLFFVIFFSFFFSYLFDYFYSSSSNTATATSTSTSAATDADSKSDKHTTVSVQIYNTYSVVSDTNGVTSYGYGDAIVVNTTYPALVQISSAIRIQSCFNVGVNSYFCSFFFTDQDHICDSTIILCNGRTIIVRFNAISFFRWDYLIFSVCCILSLSLIFLYSDEIISYFYNKNIGININNNNNISTNINNKISTNSTNLNNNNNISTNSTNINNNISTNSTNINNNNSTNSTNISSINVNTNNMHNHNNYYNELHFINKYDLIEFCFRHSLSVDNPHVRTYFLIFDEFCKFASDPRNNVTESEFYSISSKLYSDFLKNVAVSDSDLQDSKHSIFEEDLDN